MQNAVLRTPTGCTQDTHIYITKNSHFPYTSTYSSTRHNTNRKHNIQHTLTQTHNILQQSKAKILRTPPPHISSSEEVLSRLTRRTLSQPKTNKSPSSNQTYTKSTTQSHPSPLCPLCNNHNKPPTLPHHISSRQLHQHTHHIVTPGNVDRPHRSDETAHQMDGEAGGGPQA